jgi:hypothetical protein
VADDDDLVDDLPQSVVPAGGRVPFEILVDGPQSAARYDVTIDYVESLTPIRSDFVLTDLNQFMSFDRYCVRGTLRNSGGQLLETLVIVAVLYDDQANVINYGRTSPANYFNIHGDRTLSFEICVSPPNEGVTEYAVRALGR